MLYGFVDSLLHICGMEKLVSKFRARSAEISGVDFLDGRVLVGLADRIVLIKVIENLGTLGTDIREVADIGVNLRLTAAVDAAAWASHDLNEIILFLTALDHVEKCSGVGKTGSNRNTDCETGNL